MRLCVCRYSRRCPGAAGTESFMTWDEIVRSGRLCVCVCVCSLLLCWSCQTFVVDVYFVVRVSRSVCAFGTHTRTESRIEDIVSPQSFVFLWVGSAEVRSLFLCSVVLFCYLCSCYLCSVVCVLLSLFCCLLVFLLLCLYSLYIFWSFAFVFFCLYFCYNFNCHSVLV